MRHQKKKRRRHQTKGKYCCTGRKQKRQTRGFLNRYDFAYAGRDTVNQVAKVAPSVIRVAANDINNIAQERINQIISQGGKEVERVLPNILRKAIKDVYQTTFRLLGKQQLNKIKKGYYDVRILLFFVIVCT